MLTVGAALQAKEERQEHEAQVGKAQMAAALAGGASWGFGEDAPPDDAALVGQPVDWREYEETKGLTEKQVRGRAGLREGLGLSCAHAGQASGAHPPCES